MPLLYIKYIISFLLANTLLWANAQGFQMSSPSKKVRMTMTANEQEWTYSVSFNGKEIIQKSQLGIGNIEAPFSAHGTAIDIVNETLHPLYAERSEIKDICNEYSFAVAHNDGIITFKVRLYDYAIALQYGFNMGQTTIITSDETTFSFPNNTKCWYSITPQGLIQKSTINNIDIAESPITLQLPDGRFVCLMETGNTDFTLTRFKCSSGIVSCEMGDAATFASGQFLTPWRVAIFANSPSQLANSNNLPFILSEQCRINDTSWIKPGKCMRVMKFTTEEAIAYIDFAKQYGLQYVLFDAKWYGDEYKTTSDPRACAVDDLDLPLVVEYAKSNGIGVWLYVNHIALSQYIDEIAPLYESWGIAGVKFGFVTVGRQNNIKWLHNAVATCAEHHLMVDIHDNYRPLGWSRTYPNLLTQEGIRGNEEFPPSSQNAMLPFTRYMAGAGDYTICYFTPIRRGQRDDGSPYNTPAHQMALSVICYSPLQLLFWYDSYSFANNEPELDFFKQLQTTWDETVTLDGQIGEYVVQARRSGNTWFIAGITNEHKRQMFVNLNKFLQNGKYFATTYTDGNESIATTTKIAVDSREILTNEPLKFDLKPNGGFAMTITPIEYYPETNQETPKIDDKIYSISGCLLKKPIQGGGNIISGKKFIILL